MVIAFLQSRQPAVLPCLQARKLRTQKPKTVYYPVPIHELESKKRRRGNFGSGTHESSNEARLFCMIETDAFFENDLDVIRSKYLPKEDKRNSATVGQLLYEFFVFFLYEFDSTSEVISIKEQNGFAKKFQPDKLPFSIVDPFDVHKNPGRTVKIGSN
jgi:DNA polymerase sigma